MLNTLASWQAIERDLKTNCRLSLRLGDTLKLALAAAASNPLGGRRTSLTKLKQRIEPHFVPDAHIDGSSAPDRLASTPRQKSPAHVESDAKLSRINSRTGLRCPFSFGY
jgi:hypothetical protein